MKYAWLTTMAICGAVAFTAPTLVDAGGAPPAPAKDAPKVADKDDKSDTPTYSSAQELLNGLKELTKEWGKNPTKEQINEFMTAAVKRIVTYIDDNPKADDVGTLYQWVGQRMQYVVANSDFIALAKKYVAANKSAKDSGEWNKRLLVAQLGDAKEKKEAEAALAEMEKNGKNDPTKLLEAAEIRLLDARARDDDKGLKAVTDKLLANKLLTDNKDKWVYRDLQRVVLSNHRVEITDGEAFPDWADVMPVKDLEGETISIKDYAGKVVLLDFWATWCGPCMGDMPDVIELYEELNKEGFEIIGLSFDNRNGETKLRDTIAGKAKVGEMPWRQIFDGGGWGSGLAGRYGVQSIPKTVLIGKDGKVAAQGLRGAALAKKVRELVAGGGDS